MTWNEKLRNARKKRNHTLEDVRAITGLAVSTINLIERNTYRSSISPVTKSILDMYIKNAVKKEIPELLPVKAFIPNHSYISRIKTHTKNGNFQTIGYFVAEPVDSYTVRIGMSVCHPKDRFCKPMGRALAESRLRENRTYTIYNRMLYGVVPNYVEEALILFAAKAFRHFSNYNNYNIALPRVTFV